MATHIYPSDIENKALQKYGIKAQQLMLFEEMAELQNAICKESRGRATISDICEELADVKIMLEQMMLFYGEEKVADYYMQKMKRLLERLQNDKV